MTDRVVLVTGATGALGKLAAQTFASRGDSLALLSRNQDELDSLARDLDLPLERILTRTVNLLDSGALRDSSDAVEAKFGRVDVLIHLIGGWTGGKSIVETAVDDFTSMLNQHAWTTFHLFQTFAPLLALHGRVIAVSSPLVMNPTAKMGAYTAAKSAQETLVLTLAEELREKNVTANIIQVKSIDVKGTGKGTSPQEIVAKMEFLCSEEASKITGTRIALGK